MSRREVMAGALAAGLVEGLGTEAPNERPNILWISCEDIGPDLGCYAGIAPGAEYARTPNLDALAAQGRRYDRAFAVAPVCAPSRSSIITCMYPTAIGTMHMRSRGVPPPDVRCFTEYLRAAGYYCTNNSKTDYNFECPVSAWDESSPTAHWRNRPDASRPFFAVFNLLVTHESQIRAPEEVYQRNMRDVPEDLRHDPARAPLPPYYPDTPLTRRDWARYSDNITAMDFQAGRILAELEADGLARSTVVFFWGDHGRGLPRAKRWPYDSGLWVPLIARWPGRIAPGSVNSALVTLMDLGATVLQLAGVRLPAHLHGKPFMDAGGGDLPGRPVVFGHRDRMDEAEDTVRTVRDARYRYIRNLQPGRPYAQHIAYQEEMPTMKELRRLHAEEALERGQGKVPSLLTPAQRHFLRTTKPPEELYDLQEDPHEIRNLAKDPAHRGTLARMRRELDAWMRSTGDLGLMPEEELEARWRPGGKWPVTEPPRITFQGGQFVAESPTRGASIAYTTQPPTGTPDPSPPTGEPTSRRRWSLYTGPVRVERGARLWFRAHRLGWKPSPDVEAAAE